MASIEQIAVYPIKGLDRVVVGEADVLEGGTLEYDREFALVDPEGDVINGKRTDRVHDLDATCDLESRSLTVETDDGERREFDLESDPQRASEWFSDFFGEELELRRNRTLGYVDRREMGPSVVSTATLRTVASWFDDVTVEGARRRLRANVEVSGVPPFWEDRFVGPDAPALVAGDVRFEGITPCGRCVVPERDPDTGEPTSEFREQFVTRREETFPEWADPDAFDHYYTVMIITGVPEEDRGKTIRTGDPVEILGPENAPS